MRRALLLAAAVAGGLLVAPGHAAGPTGPWPAWRGQATGIMRSATLDRGELIYTNTLWLAKGANSDGLEREDYLGAALPDDPLLMTGDARRAVTYGFFGAHRGLTNGDFELPTDRERWPDGTGEVAEVRFTADADELFIRLRWHTWPSPHAQLATIAFAAKGASYGTNIAGLMLPGDRVVHITSRGAYAAHRPDVESLGHAYPIRLGDHTVEARIPLSELPKGPWTLAGGSGLADPAAPSRYWAVLPGAATADRPARRGVGGSDLWGLLFDNWEPWRFDDRHQAERLATGLSTTTSIAVDPRELQRKVTRRPPVQTGDLSRIYSSRYDGGDGITRLGDGAGGSPGMPAGSPVFADLNSSFQHTGRLQDYAMRVPAAYDARRRWPLIVYLHGFGNSPEEPFRLPLGLVDEAEKRGYVFASLRGRGDLFYEPGLGDLDVTEALADIRRHYNVDPDRIYLMGHSMGGYGTNNVATRHPDLFAAVFPAEGTASTPYVGNLRHVPWLGTTADTDLDAQGAAMNAHYDALSVLDYDATLLHFRLKIHEYSSIYDLLPRVFEHFSVRRVSRPAVVTWVRPPASEDHPELGQVYDGAYWLDGVDAGAVTVESMALPHRADAAAVRAVDENHDEGGPSRRGLAILKTTRRTPGTVQPRSNTLSVHARGTGRLTVAIDTAGLSLARLAIRSDSDQPLRMTLTRAGRPVRVLTIAPGVRTTQL